MSDNHLLSLNDIFNGRFFRIPDFQRGYSWDKSQLDDFWEDLNNLKVDKVHYTGLLTVEPVVKNTIKTLEKWQDDLWLFDRGFKSYYIIDGQQRLTTSIILINEILKLVAENEDIFFQAKQDWVKKFLFQEYKGNYKSYIFGYEKDNPSDEFFKTKILQQESATSDKVPENTLYTSNLERASQFFQDKLQSQSPKSIECLFKKLITSFKFNFYEIDNNLDVYVTFETMNNRGKPLSHLELLKNRLIYLSTLFNDQEENRRLRNDINETWKTIYEYLGKNKFSKLNDDDFLYEHWIMYFTYNREEANSYAKYLLNKKFTTKNILNNTLTFDEIKNYVSSLQKTVKYWFYLHNPAFSPYSDETKEWLQKLNRLKMGAFSPLLISVLSQHNEEDFLPLLKEAERFIFLVFLISQRRANTANSVFYRYAHEHHNGSKKLADIIYQINLLTDGERIDENGKTNYEGWVELRYFYQHINELYRKDSGFYSWNGLRYFLYEYELYLQQKAKGDDAKLTWQEFSQRKKEETIEHVYPQTDSEPYWQEHFAKFDNEQKRRLLHSLGNLTLLSRSKNSSLQNKAFPLKKKDTNKAGKVMGFFNGSYSEINISQNHDWTAQKIAERGEEMLAFMEQRWNMKFAWWQFDINELLGLKFIPD